LGIHLELGEHVKISNIQKIVNKKKLCYNSKVDVLILGTNSSFLEIEINFVINIRFFCDL
jgi:hypothetical protein